MDSDTDLVFQHRAVCMRCNSVTVFNTIAPIPEQSEAPVDRCNCGEDILPEDVIGVQETVKGDTTPMIPAV